MVSAQVVIDRAGHRGAAVRGRRTTRHRDGREQRVARDVLDAELSARENEVGRRRCDGVRVARTDARCSVTARVPKERAASAVGDDVVLAVIVGELERAIRDDRPRVVGDPNPRPSRQLLVRGVAGIDLVVVEEEKVLGPTITCPTPNPQTVCLTSGTTYTNNVGLIPNAAATDDGVCTGTVNLTFTSSGPVTAVSNQTLTNAVFGIGTSTITWTATDNCTITSTCSFSVIVYAPLAPGSINITGETFV